MEHATRVAHGKEGAEPLLVVGRLGDHPPFVGTVAQCRERHPHLDLSRSEAGPVWFGHLHLCLGHLIDPTSESAHELHAAVTGDTNAPSRLVKSWLLDDATYSPVLRGALGLIAYRQGSLTADQFRLLLAESA